MPQPLLDWPSDGINRTQADRLASPPDLIYFIREKNYGHHGRTLGPYFSLDRIKLGCEDILKTQCVGITVQGIRKYLQPLTFWELVDFALAPTQLFSKKAMPYDLIAQPNPEVALALRDLPTGKVQSLYVVKSTKTDAPFVQKLDGLEAQLPQLVEDVRIWAVRTVHLDLTSSTQSAWHIFQHLFEEQGGASWLDYTGRISGGGIFVGVILGKDQEVRAMVQVQCQTAP
ncbi:hypothetical protein K458DRAFT_384240 [Lentithecium fluviatile CBS 122367]|uniref:Uncharacterized protein n=1 Tax=Lentithecium fluviatile CBS 122367 TaxID=1168545 RepID=A0A6G1JHJ7_9PLEO|nr:hypothetical protein K458DRAFT_384240 [Lentithecium fluviatile CBS 122367]